MAVAIGPFRATRFLRTASTAAWLTLFAWSEELSERPAISSHSNWTPVASKMRRVAAATSGPIPSPGMRVTLCLIIASYCKGSAAACLNAGYRWRFLTGTGACNAVCEFCYTVEVDRFAGVPASGGQEDL